MQKYRYYLPPQSKLPFAAGILSGLLCLDNIYTLISMPHYTQYWDYWATLAAALLLCVFCFLFRQRRIELTLIPAAILALIACITPNLVHWLEVGMFFLLLLLWLLRLPKWVGTLCRLAGIVLTVIGSGAILAPMAERISMLSRTGRATAEFVVPFVIRSLGGELLILLTFLPRSYVSRRNPSGTSCHLPFQGRLFYSCFLMNWASFSGMAIPQTSLTVTQTISCTGKYF